MDIVSEDLLFFEVGEEGIFLLFLVLSDFDGVASFGRRVLEKWVN